MIASKLAPTGILQRAPECACRSELARDERPRRLCRRQHREKSQANPRTVQHHQHQTGATKSPHESATGFASPVCAPRRSREAQGHPAAIGPRTGAGWPSGEASPSSGSSQDSRPIAVGRVSQGVLSLLPFFSRKRKEVARGQRAKREPHRQPAPAGNDTAEGAVDRLYTPTPCVGLKPDLRPDQRPYQRPGPRPGRSPGHADQNHHA